jgi:hypothetical protein
MTIQLAQLRLSLSVAALALVALAGCDIKQEEIGNDPPGSGTSGSAPGSGGAGAAGGGSGQGGDGGRVGNGGAGSGGATCHGDVAAWEAATQAPIACTKNSDCCVVINLCVSEAQIVHASNADAAKAAWPYCDLDCKDCIPPEVSVFCHNSQCVGIAGEPSGSLPMDHCGVDDEPGEGGGSGEHFSCGD